MQIKPDTTATAHFREIEELAEKIKAFTGLLTDYCFHIGSEFEPEYVAQVLMQVRQDVERLAKENYAAWGMAKS